MFENFQSKLQTSLQKGRKINFDRCQKESEILHFAKFKSNGVRKEKSTYICKILYPREVVYPECNHMNRITLNRTELTPNEYLNILSKPKKHYQKPFPKLVAKKITSCTAHINTLAQPKKSRVLETLRTHHYHFEFKQVEVLLNYIHSYENQTPEQTLQIIKQRIKDRKRKIKLQKCHIRKLKKNIGKNVKLQELTFYKFRDLKLTDLLEQKNLNLKTIEKLILTRLCQMSCYKVPNEKSKNVVDKAYIKLAKKYALQIQSMQKLSDESDCKKKCKNVCFPIQSYHPEILLKQISMTSFSVSKKSSNKSLSSQNNLTKESEEERIENEDEIKIFNSEELLQIKNECKNLDERLREEAEKIEVKRKNRAEERAFRADEWKKSNKKGIDNESDNDDENGNNGKNKKKKTREIREKKGESKVTADQKWEVEWEDKSSP
ncbi:hypothetical protein PVAND_011167 [Polypedilum vanderplanki]|uniref:Uncharacterized protein n=1 Tax=Polypedilum vanderplanki TaxID=319348 RepID=A0A9J6CJK7_POLVA|nr:hypothetical protein PVAND_011167 [Polypedilum vanderplanki]